MSDYLEIDPATADKRQIYRMLVGSVVPRPIGWASTLVLHCGLRCTADDLIDDCA
jgi:hypothetical protein